VQKSKPLIERVVTVTGKSLGSPANLLVRIGTPVARLFEEAGGLPEDTGKVISGGPMMGKALPSLDIPVCKGTSGIVVMSGDEARRTDPEPCIRCAKCVSVCPMGLEPYLLATASSMSCWDKVEDEDIMTCVECGSCQYTCPSHRPLLDYIRNGKRHVGNIIKSRNQKK
ncbi:MAG TPA: SLBB domain-containing protein, partial [Candidatus Avibacteroides avistercoris]|nr:SLBB domain-containing protein [Candidatus Avibacteroides avistercoris]